MLRGPVFGLLLGLLVGLAVVKLLGALGLGH
jgi:hypothetical protein